MTNSFAGVSFEFFPPKTDQGLERLLGCAKQLQQFEPGFCSVTFGAGGSSQQQTLRTVCQLQEGGITSLVPHISCVAMNQQRMHEMIEQYLSRGINQFVVLRGDQPADQPEAFLQWKHASELVTFLRDRWGERLHLSVACYPEAHPESMHLRQGLGFFMQKMRAGADQAMTQFFYNAESYRRFVHRCRSQGLLSPIIPGVMPLDNFSGIKRFAGRCGAEIPRWLDKEMLAYENDEQGAFEVGVEIVTALCVRLVELGAPSLHFYTLNRATAVSAILQQLQRQGVISLSAQRESLVS